MGGDELHATSILEEHMQRIFSPQTKAQLHFKFQIQIFVQFRFILIIKFQRSLIIFPKSSVKMVMAKSIKQTSLYLILIKQMNHRVKSIICPSSLKGIQAKI